jgi:hypothetical protein
MAANHCTPKRSNILSISGLVSFAAAMQRHGTFA